MTDKSYTTTSKSCATTSKSYYPQKCKSPIVLGVVIFYTIKVEDDNIGVKSIEWLSSGKEISVI